MFVDFPSLTFLPFPFPALFKLRLVVASAQPIDRVFVRMEPDNEETMVEMKFERKLDTRRNLFRATVYHHRVSLSVKTWQRSKLPGGLTSAPTTPASPHLAPRLHHLRL